MDNVANFAIVVVSGRYDADDLTIVLFPGMGAKLPAPPFNLVWWNVTDYGNPADDPYVEIVRCTEVSTDTLTVIRAQESTSASVKNISGKIYEMLLSVTAKTITDIVAVAAVLGTL